MAQPDPEQPIADLPHGATAESFRVFAVWLKENRKALEGQITGLAIRFEEIDRENKRRLDEIHAETRKTNGRVTDLEHGVNLEHALADGHQEWESAREQTTRHNAEETARITAVREAKREKRIDRLQAFAVAAVSALLGYLAAHGGHF